jgi:hypothetical protein
MLNLQQEWNRVRCFCGKLIDWLGWLLGDRIKVGIFLIGLPLACSFYAVGVLALYTEKTTETPAAVVQSKEISETSGLSPIPSDSWDRQVRAYQLHEGAGSEAQIEETAEKMEVQSPVVQAVAVALGVVIVLCCLALVFLGCYLLQKMTPPLPPAKPPKPLWCITLSDGWTFTANRQGDTEIKGIIVNSGHGLLRDLRVHFELFDDSDVLLGTASDFIQMLSPEQKWAFVAVASNKQAKWVKPSFYEFYNPQAEEPQVFWWIGFSA